MVLVIGQMRSVVVFKTNTPVITATADREAVTTGGQNDVYTTLLTTRGRLRKISGGRGLDFGLIENKESYKLLCRFQSALEYSITANMKVEVDNKGFTIDTWEKVDEINHLYEFVLNIQKVFDVVVQLGPELVRNGGFVTTYEPWEFGAGWAYDVNKMTFTPTGSIDVLRQLYDTPVDQGTYLKVSFDITGTIGFVTAIVGSSGHATFNAGSGSVSFSGVWDNGYLIEFIPSANFNGSIDNVSVKEIL